MGTLGSVQITGLASGGGLARFLEDLFVAPLTAPGGFVLLVAIAAVGLMLALNLPLRELVKPGTSLARWLGTAAAASLPRGPRPPSRRRPPSRPPATAKWRRRRSWRRSGRFAPSTTSPRPPTHRRRANGVSTSCPPPPAPTRAAGR